MNIFNFLRGARKNKINTIVNDALNFDLGASSIKYLLKGKEGSFRSSIRVVTNENEITTQKNIIKVNGVWYAIGENQTSPSSQLRKIDKEHFQIFMIYALIRQKADDGQYNINLLLPFNQLGDKIKAAKIINGQYEVITTDKKNYKYNLYLDNVYPEGQMSKYYIDKLFPKDDGNKVIGNIGFSTSDFVGHSPEGEQSLPNSNPTAMNAVLVAHNKVIHARNSSILSVWKSQGYKYTNEQLKATRELEKGVVDGLMNDVFIDTLSNYTPSFTTLYLCGGGSVALEYSINRYIENTPLLKGYKIVVLKGKDALYTDLFGMALYTNSNLPIDKIENKEIAVDKYENNYIEESTKESTEKEIVDNNKIMDKIIVDKIMEEDNIENLTDKEIEIIELYLKHKGQKGHTQKHYADMLNVNDRRFKYLLTKYKTAHSKENEPNANNNNIIQLKEINSNGN